MKLRKNSNCAASLCAITWGRFDRTTASFSSQAHTGESWAEEVVHVPIEGQGRPHPSQSPVLQTLPLAVCGAVHSRIWPGVPPPATRAMRRQQHLTGYLHQHPTMQINQQPGRSREEAHGGQNILWNQSGQVTSQVCKHPQVQSIECIFKILRGHMTQNRKELWVCFLAGQTEPTKMHSANDLFSDYGSCPPSCVWNTGCRMWTDCEALWG